MYKSQWLHFIICTLRINFWGGTLLGWFRQKKQNGTAGLVSWSGYFRGWKSCAILPLWTAVPSHIIPYLQSCCHIAVITSNISINILGLSSILHLDTVWIADSWQEGIILFPSPENCLSLPWQMCTNVKSDDILPHSSIEAQIWISTWCFCLF